VGVAAADGALLGSNLVANPSFENFDPDPDNGSIFGSLAVFEWDGDRAFAYDFSQGYTSTAPPGAGDKFWYGGGNGGGSITQTIDVSTGETAGAIASGGAHYDLSAFFSSYQTQDDNGTVMAQFLDSGDGELASDAIGGQAFLDTLLTDGDGARMWGQDATGGSVPIGTTTILLTLTGDLQNGDAADGYIDLVNLTITPEPASLALLGLGGLLLARRRRE